MATRTTVYPVTGRLVRHPATKQPIPAEGIEVEPDSFWRRRLADGDVSVTKPVPTAQPASDPAPAKSKNKE